MAKRRRLGAPDAEKLRKLNEGFAAKPILATKSMAPPIAQIAGEAAAMGPVGETHDRVEQARNATDARSLQAAKQEGRLAEVIAVADIDTSYLNRDRLETNAESMEELKTSLREQGQRTPIEVVKTPDGYGLISGWRRLCALGALYEATNDTAYNHVTAFVRMPKGSAEAYLNMVEENEIRTNLSHYERGRIAVVAVGQGVYADIDAAVNHLFQAASKAKRSKLRSFAMIHEALGDLLQFPQALTERSGLKLAAALRSGPVEAFRAGLADVAPQSAAQEWKVLEGLISATAGQGDAPHKGGRPVKTQPLPSIALKKGGSLQIELTARGCKIELKDRVVDRHTLMRIAKNIEQFLK